MKLQFRPALLALSFFIAFNAGAADRYVGVSVGRTEQTHTFEQQYHVLDTGTALKLYGGYQFSPMFGVEAAYLNHGETSIGSATLKARTLYVAPTVTMQLSKEFAVFGKIGIARSHVDLDVPDYYSNKLKRTHAMAGVGASFAFRPGTSAVVEYEHLGKVAKFGSTIDANVISIGVRQSF
jgi:OOP family OmpA-OmpF porin